MSQNNLYYPAVALGLISLWSFAYGFEKSVERVKRGAAGYVMFQGGQGQGAGQNNYFPGGANPFIQYLGGSQSGSGGYGGSGSGSGGQQASNTYSFSAPAPAPPSTGGYQNSFDQSPLGSYNLYTSTQPSWSPPATNSNGWQPSGGSGSSSGGYGNSGNNNGGVYIPYYGLTTPNFANSGSSGSTMSYPSTSASSHVPQLSANVLLQAAQSSSYSQNHLFDVLTQGSPQPTSYKGGSF